jgi:hypothetical protein
MELVATMLCRPAPVFSRFSRNTHFPFRPRVPAIAVLQLAPITRLLYIKERLGQNNSSGNLPPFAIEGDIRQLLDESGFSPDLILVRYRGGNGNLHRTCAAVVLSTAEQASRALKELHDAALFDKKITCLAYEPEKPSTEPHLTWGWYATSHPGFGHVRHRAPLLSPPTNV